MKPLVSILMPAFNAEKWIADTIKSAIGQTWQRKEIIIVDDGSTDRTLQIARQFASQEVVVVTQENQGASAARNKAFSISQGEYIQWLDADDLLSSEKIARQMAVAETCQDSRVVLSSAWGRFLSRVRRAQFIPTRLWCDLSPAEWMIRKMSENLFMQTATWLVSREASSTAGPWNAQLYVDNDGEYFARVVIASHGIRFVPEARTYYRMTGPRSVSYIGTSKVKLDSKVLAMQLQVRYLRSIEDSPRIREACLRYLRDGLIHFYPNRLDLLDELKQTAAELGGTIEPPSLSWKYKWVSALFGGRVAKRAQLLLPMAKWTLKRSWDRALFRLENGRGPAL
jgi:glycosyltransferase involved in cell wall biosynthesis